MPEFKVLSFVLQLWAKDTSRYETDGAATEVAAVLWSMGHLALVSDRDNSSCGSQAVLPPLQPSPCVVQGQAGWGLEQPGLVEGELELDDLLSPFWSKPFYEHNYSLAFPFCGYAQKQFSVESNYQNKSPSYLSVSKASFKAHIW